MGETTVSPSVCLAVMQQAVLLETRSENLLVHAATEHSEGGGNCRADVAMCPCRGLPDVVASRIRGVLMFSVRGTSVDVGPLDLATSIPSAQRD